MRILLLGAGQVSRHHLIAWSRVAEARIVGIVDPAADRAAARAAEFGVPACSLPLAEALAALRPNAVDIATPAATHDRLVRVAAVAGVPALVQKPLGPSLAEAKALAEWITARRARVMVHENWRFRPHYRTAATWLAEGRIGRPGLFRLQLRSAGLLPGPGGAPPPALARQPFLARMERLLVLELLIHHLDTLRFLLGGLEVLGAALARLATSVVGEDTAEILLRSSDGAIGSLGGSLSCVGEAARSTDRLEIFGTTGTIRYADGCLVCEGALPAGIICSPDVAYQQGFDAAIAHFAARLRDGGPFETSPGDNLETLRLVEAVYAAASAGGNEGGSPAR